MIAISSRRIRYGVVSSSMIFVTDFNRLRFISAILAVGSSRLILWLLLILKIMIQGQYLDGTTDVTRTWVGQYFCCSRERTLTKKVDYSTLVLQRRKKNGRLPVYYKVIFLLTLPFSLKEQPVLSCASFDRILKTFLFNSSLSDSFARRALWQDGLGTPRLCLKEKPYPLFFVLLQIFGIDLCFLSALSRY